VTVRVLAAFALIAVPAALAARSRTAGDTRRVEHTPRHAWHRVFFDNFRHGLKSSRWGRYSGQPDGDPGGWFAPSHAVVRHGILNLESYRDPRFGDRWVSAGVSSAPALKQTYGKYELRLRMGRGRGISMVALLWPVRDVWPPEIDFAENGGESNQRKHVTATLHYGRDNRQIQRTVHANFARWHVVGVEWTPGRLVYTLDGHRWATVTSHAVPAQAMELDVQAQAGTCGDVYDPCPGPETPAHVNAQIDWVAAWSYRPG
jgi:beta-glucanase (GH16 family)